MINNKWSKMHLQWFAEEPPVNANPVEPPVEPIKDNKPDFDNLYKDNQTDFEKWVKESDFWKKNVIPWKDQQVTQGLNTWKEKHLPTEIEKKVSEAKSEWDKIGKLDPVQQAQAAAKIEIDKFRAEAERARIKADASELIGKLNLKLGKLTIDDFLRASQDETNDVLNRYYEERKEFEKQIREEEGKKFVSKNNYVPQAGNAEAVPYGGSHEKHAEAIRRGETPATGSEFMKIDKAIADYIRSRK